MIKKYAKHPVVSGSFFMLSASLVVNGINFLFSILVIKLLPHVVYGEYTAIFAYVYLLALPFTMFSLVLIKKVGGRKTEERIKFSKWLENYVFQIIKKYAYLLIIFGLILYAGLFYWSNFLYWYSGLFIALFLFFSFLNSFYDSMFKALKWLLAISLISVFFVFLKLTLSFFAIRIHNNLLVLLLIILFLGFCDLSLRRYLFRKKTKKVDFTNYNNKKLSWKNVFKKDIILTLLTTFGVLGLVNFDLILVKKFLLPEKASLYSLLSLFLRAVTFVFAPLISAGYIFFTNQDHKHQQNKILLLFITFFVVIGIAITFFYTIFGEYLILIAAKESYLPIVKYLPIAGLSGLFYSLNWLFSQYFLAQESKLSLLIFITGILQIIVLYFFHQSYEQVFYLNLSLYFSLFFVYFLSFLILTFKKIKNKI